MPEAPEVQTVVSTLETQIKGQRIEEVLVYYPKIIETDSFVEQMTGQQLHTFSRWGKYLILGLDDYDWIIHLRMEGRFYLYEQCPKEQKHIHVAFRLSDGRYLCYHDTRKFGRMGLYRKENDWSLYPPLSKLGPDYSDMQWDADALYRAIHSAKRPLKSALLDQRIVAGIGNIYADEICFACRLDPRSRCTRISKQDCENIVFHTRRILEQATASGGTTIRTYTSSLGISGRFQMQLRIHDRKGQNCPVCQRPIEKITVAQRGTYLCRHCQKRK
ncbi:MAG: bifunctional DNA-formamidopyrimidine glycosylase/DNA-(apurinic or apyrimidinic site) lyase [Erysipelotrichaceae bacterium]|nr:bifunctional DNA-formamidopyrimidine glycosylase/DNA-(apurinic or apyrimidinic site) lyase [Erysipelotrichaceae bacterium]